MDSSGLSSSSLPLSLPWLGSALKIIQADDTPLSQSDPNHFFGDLVVRVESEEALMSGMGEGKRSVVANGALSVVIEIERRGVHRPGSEDEDRLAPLHKKEHSDSSATFGGVESTFSRAREEDTGGHPLAVS